MTTTLMTQTTIREATHLFEVMRKYGVKCSVELKVEGEADPLVGISAAAVNLDFANDASWISVILGDADFSFTEAKDTVFKHIGRQIDVCFSSDRYTAWFLSSGLPPQGVLDAYSYAESEGEYTSAEGDKENQYSLDRREKSDFFRGVDGLLFDLSGPDRYIKEFDGSELGKYRVVVATKDAATADLTPEELELISFIRSLEFEDLLDAESGIENVANQASDNATRSMDGGNRVIASGFEERAEKLAQLVKLLGHANKDYRDHISPITKEGLK